MDLEQIFRAHQKEIFVYFLRTVGQRELAEDLAQETFVRACRAALLYRAEASIRTWLFSIARATMADHFRKRNPEVLQDPEDTVVVSGTEKRLEVEEALAALPLASREALTLCDVLGMPQEEAATALGIDGNAFRVRLHRARRRFREVYGVEG